ncbi:MAG: hypothetical protein NTX50_10010, partial [Candidatus Sumerlaeota bacterium]|nr:hypothetical protein [Candidatus Sumerlaeota bacterium]
ERAKRKQPRATPWEQSAEISESPERAKEASHCLSSLSLPPLQGLIEMGIGRSQGVALGCFLSALSGHLW